MTQAAKLPSTATRVVGWRGEIRDSEVVKTHEEGLEEEQREQDLSRNQGGVQRAVEQVTDRVRAATSNPVDTFAVTPDMSKVLTAWLDMVGDMMKLQQQFFSTVLNAGNTNTRTTMKV